MYDYTADVLRVIDGDTLELNIDLGFKVYLTRSCRLAGLNAPELNSADPIIRTQAQKSRDALSSLLLDERVQIHSRSLDKYGRPIVTITAKGLIVNDWLIENGYAVKL